MDIPKYRMERWPFSPARYDGYLAMYGSTYGDMGDPVKRADTITALRRRDGMASAAACRELRREISTRNTDELTDELAIKRYLIEQGAGMRPWNIRNSDIHAFRMVVNELRIRGVIPAR